MEVIEGGYPDRIEVPPTVEATMSTSQQISGRIIYVHQTEGLNVRMVREDCLNHLRSKFWVPNPLELSERSELRKHRTKYPWFEAE